MRARTRPALELMLNTGLTLEMMTPRLREQLQLPKEHTSLQGLSLAGLSCSAETTRQHNRHDPSFPLSLPEWHAVVTDFPHEHVDPQHDTIAGMLGMELLS